MQQLTPLNAQPDVKENLIPPGDIRAFFARRQKDNIITVKSIWKNKKTKMTVIVIQTMTVISSQLMIYKSATEHIKLVFPYSAFFVKCIFTCIDIKDKNDDI